jgi:hypothetical protein
MLRHIDLTLQERRTPRGADNWPKTPLAAGWPPDHAVLPAVGKRKRILSNRKSLALSIQEC